MDNVPETITLWVCPFCARKEWSRNGFGNGVRHYFGGKRCPGTPEPVEYRQEAA